MKNKISLKTTFGTFNNNATPRWGFGPTTGQAENRPTISTFGPSTTNPFNTTPTTTNFNFGLGTNTAATTNLFGTQTPAAPATVSTFNFFTPAPTATATTNAGPFQSLTTNNGSTQTNLFGMATSPTTGTGNPPYKQTSDLETIKGEPTKFFINSISAMKEYKDKSYEELRHEDSKKPVGAFPNPFPSFSTTAPTVTPTPAPSASPNAFSNLLFGTNNNTAAPAVTQSTWSNPFTTNTTTTTTNPFDANPFKTNPTIQFNNNTTTTTTSPGSIFNNPFNTTTSNALTLGMSFIDHSIKPTPLPIFNINNGNTTPTLFNPQTSMSLITPAAVSTTAQDPKTFSWLTSTSANPVSTAPVQTTNTFPNIFQTGNTSTLLSNNTNANNTNNTAQVSIFDKPTCGWPTTTPTFTWTTPTSTTSTSTSTTNDKPIYSNCWFGLAANSSCLGNNQTTSTMIGALEPIAQPTIKLNDSIASENPYFPTTKAQTLPKVLFTATNNVAQVIPTTITSVAATVPATTTPQVSTSSTTSTLQLYTPRSTTKLVPRRFNATQASEAPAQPISNSSRTTTTTTTTSTITLDDFVTKYSKSLTVSTASETAASLRKPAQLFTTAKPTGDVQQPAPVSSRKVKVHQSKPVVQEIKSNPKAPKLTLTGYACRPTIEQLQSMSDNELAAVNNFYVERIGYGSVLFLGNVDLRGLDLDQLIVFEKREITVYPDDSKKPAVGEGLNRKSMITLQECWPQNKDGTFNKSEKHFELYTKLLKNRERQGAHFIDYDGNEGVWRFNVDHF
ncbi:hypothetical protein SAMD00019534_064110 [Acytostelium subglobosum LB1]|uniref:hypothetical protein n=1 Tax=Acytostelium subglobosum LB1 TaxID=1410327 RepID=UPI0006451E00|nr:hypothetical protein SAMD00019534_064110 [Acytostelium subglobosum LB1]GAM23236.1 hypothetical protein SAMD00019534_064110 [Acytostelium subglobosum LB1]|eukprot:XP_012753685.1 hypothetical protein SAMD00019534_064110 [Acytostelium subglobosum LB1]